MMAGSLPLTGLLAPDGFDLAPATVPWIAAASAFPSPVCSTPAFSAVALAAVVSLGPLSAPSPGASPPSTTGVPAAAVLAADVLALFPPSGVFEATSL
jgi:hypothetical protein